MSFRNLNIEISYINQGEKNIVDCLINPALKQAVKYRRSVGYFSSSVFSLLMNSLPEFIKNNGEIQLIVSPNLNDDDIEAIELGYEKKSAYIGKKFLEEFEKEISCFNEYSLNILAELVARGFLDIRIASVKNESGIYHDKLGILTDKENNHIVFYGSANSSVNGYKNNYEKVRVVKSWTLGEQESVEDEIREFDELWNNNNPYVEVLLFKESVQQCIINVIEKKKQQSVEPITLFDYQKTAIENWVKNKYTGFYVMATGTGKTWTAIYSAKELLKTKNALIVIAAPYKHLVRQWADDVKKVFPEAGIVLISSENPSWYSVSRQLIIGQKYNESKQVILITTISSFNSDRFAKLMELSTEEKLLIVDEAHRFTRRPEELKHQFKYMLGLSATPINGKNNETGEELVRFFGGQVFSLPIDIALEKNFLVPYYYKPIFITPTDDEEVKFNKISRDMAACYKDGVLVDRERFVRLFRARLRVIAMAESKMTHLNEFLRKIEDKDHFVVYCGDGRLFDEQDEEIRHIQFVKRHLDNLGIKTSQFTASEDMQRRMELVDMFNNNEIASLTAIRCLDEGINIPSIKSALILASNDDYREFVQRRGRILRKYPNKENATIYDVIVLPSANTPKMALIELRRYFEYAKLAINKEDLLGELNILLGNYNLQIEDVMLYTDIDMEADLDE